MNPSTETNTEFQSHFKRLDFSNLKNNIK
jgi:hypothetical protein